MIQLPGGLACSSNVYYLALALSTVATLYLLYHAFSRLRRARWVEDTPTSRIRSAAQGLVELCGRVDAGGHAPLISPLGGEPCLWYRFRVEEYRRSGRNQQWQTVETGQSDRPFVLRDATGECWVLPQGAEVHPRQRRRWEGRQRWPLSHNSGSSLLGAMLGRRYRYTEEYLRQDDLLYALGWFHSHSGGAAPVDAQRVARQIISSWKADYADLLARFDRNRDGQLDMQEWQQVRAGAASEARRRAAATATAALQHQLGKPPYRGLPFLLSDQHEQHLSRHLRRQSRWSLAGMLIAAAVAGWLWLGLLAA